MRTTGLVQLAALAALALLPGCRTVVERSELGWKPEEAYQAIANALPRADFGFGEAPGVVALAASERGHRGEAPDLSVLTDEQAFRVRLSVLRTRTILVPYAAVEEVSVEWCPFPNVPLALLVVVPAQLSLARVTFDARKVPGLLASIEVECDRLEHLAAETAVASPWYHAQQVREKLRDDELAFGPGRVSVGFAAWTPVPPWIPATGASRRLADAFVWARDAARAPPAEPPRGH